MMNATCKVDTRGLNDAIAERLEFGNRTLPDIVNTSAYYIAVDTIRRSPFSKQEQIDQELDTFVIPKTLVTPTGQVSFRGKKRFFGPAGSKRKLDGQPVPLAALIIAKRASKDYKGNPKWALSKNPFANESKAQGQAEMKALMEKMLKTRHSSTSYMRSAWIMAIKLLQDFIVPVARGGLRPDRGASRVDVSVSQRGDATIGKPGPQSTASILNRTGTAGFTDDGKVNEHLIAQETGPLQEAINAEERSLAKYMAAHLKPGDDRFNEMAK